VARALADTGADDFLYPLHELIEDLKINSDFEIWRLCESYATAALLAELPPRSMLVEGRQDVQAALAARHAHCERREDAGVLADDASARHSRGGAAGRAHSLTCASTARRRSPSDSR
jgi:hypothetical protein